MNVCESTKRTKKAKQPAGDKQSRKKRADQVGERVNAEEEEEEGVRVV